MDFSVCYVVYKGVYENCWFVLFDKRGCSGNYGFGFRNFYVLEDESGYFFD